MKNQEIQKAADYFLNQKSGTIAYRRISSARKAYHVMAELYYTLESDNPQSFSATETKLGRRIVSVKTDRDTFTAFYNAKTKTLEVYIKQFLRERVDLNGVKPKSGKAPKPKAQVNLEFINFEPLVLRSRYSTRGGGVEIDLTNLGYPKQKMSAYQNYLGGGMLGAIANSCTTDWDANLRKIASQLNSYFSEKAHGVPKETFEGRVVSAY